MKFTDMLAESETKGTAIASINVYNAESIKGALIAADRAKSPVIIAFAARYLSDMSLEEVKKTVDLYGKCTDMPYALHLDHCRDKVVITNALEAGFDSVMYDGSQLPFDENIKNTYEMSLLAHQYGAAIEAELGAVATGVNASEESGSTTLFTDPEQAVCFVENTKIDALAVSVGTVHGLYKAKPNIQFELIREIHRKIGTPLVLHGGSDTDKEILKKTIQCGIRKINVNTDISIYCVNGLREMLENESTLHLSEISSKMVSLFAEKCEYYIRMFRLE